MAANDFTNYLCKRLHEVYIMHSSKGTTAIADSKDAGRRTKR